MERKDSIFFKGSARSFSSAILFSIRVKGRPGFAGSMATVFGTGFGSPSRKIKNALTA